MSALFSISAFLSVIIHGLDLIAQSVLIGSVLYLLLLAQPLAARLGISAALILAQTRRVIQYAAIAEILLIASSTALNAAVLQSSLDMAWGDIVSAGFVHTGSAKLAAALAMLLIASWRPLELLSTRAALALLCIAVIAAALADSHAVARLDGRAAMLAASALHQIGAALWLGGLPCFALALARVSPGSSLALIASRYSAMAMGGVAMIVIGAIGLSVGYIGSLDGFYGTAYGAMAATKGVLLGVLLLLGLGNFLSIRHFAGASGLIWPCPAFCRDRDRHRRLRS